MSSSLAPCESAVCASASFVEVWLAPRGKPITVHTLTADCEGAFGALVRWLVPCELSMAAATGTNTGFTQTEAKRNFKASWQRFSMSDCVACGFSRVWSMRAATAAGSWNESCGFVVIRIRCR